MNRRFTLKTFFFAPFPYGLTKDDNIHPLMIVSFRSKQRQRHDTVEVKSVQYSTVHLITVQYSTFHYSTVQYISLQYSTVHFITVQYSTFNYSTVRVTSEEQKLDK